MRRERACMSRIVLAGLLTLGLRGWSAEPPAKPATKAPAVKMDPEVAKRIAILKDLELDDGERATARDELAGRKLVGKDSVKALNHLGRTSENDNVRMHVAIALGRLKSRKVVKQVDVEMLDGWQTAEDAALRHWAALAIANTRTAEAIKLLDNALNKPGPGGIVTCSAVARAIGAWRGKGGVVARKALVGMLANEQAGVRSAGVGGLRIAKSNDKTTIHPLAKLAGEDDEAAAWRAAESTLNALTVKMKIRRLLIPVNVAKAQRKEAVRVWLFEYNRALKAVKKKP